MRPSASVKVTVFTGASASDSPSASGPSYISVDTIRSLGTISRNSPWKPTSKPSLATITYRHLPPTRRSISQVVTSPRFPPTSA